MGTPKISSPIVGNIPKSGETGIFEFDLAKKLFDKGINKLKSIDKAKAVKIMTNPKAVINISRDIAKQAGLASVYGGLEAAELFTRTAEQLQFLGTPKTGSSISQDLKYEAGRFRRHSGLNLNRKSAQVGRAIGFKETAKIIAAPIVIGTINSPEILVIAPIVLRGSVEIYKKTGI